MNASRGTYSVLIAATLWSTSGAFAKWIALDGTRMAFWRVVFAGVLLLAFVKRKHIRFQFPMLVMVGCFALMNVSFVTAMTKTTAANVIFLQYTSVFFITLASLLMGETFERENIFSLVCGLIGVVILLWGTNPSDIGVWLALVAGMSYAGVTLTLRKLRNEDPFFLISLNLIGSALGIGLICAARGVPLTVELPQLGWLCAFGVFQTALPYLFFAYGLKFISAQRAGILTLFEPVLNPVVTYLCVREIPSTQTLWGGLFLLFGVASQYYLSSRDSAVGTAK